MKVVYARISTANQNAERQMKKEAEQIYLDVCSGSIPFAERPAGAKLLKAKNVTEIEVASVDRLGRNLSDILNTLKTLTEKGVNVYIKNQGLHTMIDGKANPYATMLIQIMGSIAEFERQQIRRRVSSGAAAAISKADREGYKLYKGRPAGATADLKKLRKKHLEKIKVIQSCLSQGQSINSISKEYNYNRGLIYRLIEKGLV